jgi:hypothetical protein
MTEIDITDHRSSLETAVGDLKSTEGPPILPAVPEVAVLHPPKAQNAHTKTGIVPTPDSISPPSYRLEWSQLHDRASGRDFPAEEETPTLVQAFLVLLTAPFMLLQGVFKMIGIILRGIGMMFIKLGSLAEHVTYKPRNRQEHGSIA